MHIRVYGDPAPQGSKTARVVNGHVVMWESSKKLPGWRESVVMAAKVAFMERERQQILGPVSLHCTFFMPRPKSVSRKYPNTAPDLDKLLRGIGDALQVAGVISNDGQIVAITAKKVYSEVPADNGVEIWLTKQL
jgi:Holliday junction resolvase RusA-like endonuclease